MKTINTISETLGYTIDTYGMFNPDGFLPDDEYAEDDEKLGEYGVDWDFDHTAYTRALADNCAEILTRACSYDWVKVKATFEATGAYSPREYNFATDNAELTIEFEDSALMAYVKKHLPQFKEYISEHFTSRSGFMSFVANNWPEFKAELDGEQTGSDRNWAIMLGWYMREAAEVLTDDDYIDAMNEAASEAAYNAIIDVAKEVK